MDMNLKRLKQIKDNASWVNNILDRIKAYYGVGRRIKESQYKELADLMMQNEALSKKVMNTTFPKNADEKKQVVLDKATLIFSIKKASQNYSGIVTSRYKYAKHVNIEYSIKDVDTNTIIGSSVFTIEGRYDANIMQDACKAQALFNLLNVKF